MTRRRILYLEPFEAGSHAAFTRTLTHGIDAEWTTLTLPGRHWKWRMRGAASWFASEHADLLAQPWDLVWASSYLNLTELIGLAPSLASVPRVLYFHENQFAYPERDGPFDAEFGFAQMVSAKSATRLVFNSEWNRSSFFDGATALLSRLPDAVPSGWVASLRVKSDVLPLPLDLPDLSAEAFIDPRDDAARALGPVILWNHRWEHDKRPEAFFAVLARLAADDVPFRLIVCGKRFRDATAVFETSREALGARVLHWGTATTREAYVELLTQSHVAVSTAAHEFFGVSLVEAAWCGARPLAPRRLAYPEVVPDESLYDDDAALENALRNLCAAWTRGEIDLRQDRRDAFNRFRIEHMLPRYAALIDAVTAEPLTGRTLAGRTLAP